MSPQQWALGCILLAFYGGIAFERLLQPAAWELVLFGVSSLFWSWVFRRGGK